VARGDLDNAVLAEPLPGPLGEVVHASVRQIVSSVRQREELQSAQAHRAAHDPLTELPNRAQAMQLTASALSRARRSGAMTGLLFVDLDGFKAVNDTHGHACGDEVLRAVAGRLEAAVRSGDVVCRLGGDEFVVLVEPVETERDLLELAERLIAVVGEPITTDGHQLRVGASIGVAVSRDAVTDATCSSPRPTRPPTAPSATGAGGPRSSTRRCVRSWPSGPSWRPRWLGAGRRGDAAALPAGGRRPDRAAHRLRGAVALGPARGRHGGPGRLRPGRRGVPADL
ncbi:hypothetical protein A7K94_0220790, partial [Modestobacter sp. VKM Ac-2676]